MAEELTTEIARKPLHACYGCRLGGRDNRGNRGEHDRTVRLVLQLDNPGRVYRPFLHPLERASAGWWRAERLALTHSPVAAAPGAARTTLDVPTVVLGFPYGPRCA